MRRWVLGGAAILAVLLITVPVAALLYLTRTESGLRFVVDLVPSRIGRASLDIGEVRGTLASGITVDHVEVNHERVRLRLDGISGRIDLLPTLVQTISISDLVVRDAFVEVRRRTTPPPKSEPRFLPRGLRITAERARVEHAVLLAPNGTRLEATQLSASWAARHKSIRFYEAAGIWNEARIDATGELRAADPMQLTAAARIALQLPEQPAWLIEASAEGSLDELPIEARFQEPFQAKFTGRALELTRAWRWEGKARIQDFDLRAWGAGDALGRITGELALRGDRDGFTARGPLTPAGLEAGEFLTELEGAYADKVVEARRIEITHRSSQAHATAAGRIEVVDDGPLLELRGTWRDFRWPLVGQEVAARSAAGEYGLSGVWPYALTAAGDLTPGPLPAMTFEMQGTLDKQSLVVTQATVQALEGESSLSGDVAWAPAETWSFTGQARGINPGVIRKDLPGELDFAFAAAGEGFGDESDFRIMLRDIGGKLRGVRASGGGTIARRTDAWELSRVRVRLGRTDLSADGRIADRVDLRFSVDAQDLSLLAPESRGRLRALGTVRGTVENPVVDVVASGSGIEHEDIRLDSFTADIDLDARGDALTHVALRAVKLQVNERMIERVRFDLDGAASSHAVRIGIRATGLDLAAEANGSFASGLWRGQLRTLTVKGEDEALDLALEQPADVALSRELARLDFTCLRGKPARVCADANWSPSKWAATLTTTELPLSALTAGLTPSIEYHGTVNVVARGFGGGGEPTQGNLRADLIDAQLVRRTPSGRVDTITLGSGLLLATASRESLDAQVSLDAREIGTIGGELHARRTSDDWRALPLRGELRAQTDELDLLSLYVPQIDRAAGRLTVDLTLSGTLGVPLVSGLVRVRDGELDFYQVNLAMRQVSLEARLLENGVDFSGAATLGEGVARANGRIEWRDKKP
ncbi:MAG TPA: hypothetical protein VJ011_06010, partial [Steroidobacteraceae bacterium]|nr:hypothetical protein [Steroidobacteraceae bacterium]